MCKGPECLYLGETFHINTVSNPRKPRPLANHTSGFLALPWSPGLGRACGPTQPALPSSFHPNSATPCTPKGVPLYYHPAPQLQPYSACFLLPTVSLPSPRTTFSLFSTRARSREAMGDLPLGTPSLSLSRSLLPESLK